MARASYLKATPIDSPGTGEQLSIVRLHRQAFHHVDVLGSGEELPERRRQRLAVVEAVLYLERLNAVNPIVGIGGLCRERSGHNEAHQDDMHQAACTITLRSFIRMILVPKAATPSIHSRGMSLIWHG